jgi:hypothetical protein
MCLGNFPPGYSSISKAYEDKVNSNRRALCTILEWLDVILTIGMRGIALRGRWDKDDNFQFIIDKFAAYDRGLHEHLLKSDKNARYISPTIQNEMINTIGSMVRESIIKRANSARFLSVMAEEMSVCIRYVLRGSKATITSTLMESLKSWGLDMSKLRGKGFDGASTMSGAISGAQTRIQEMYTKAKYFTHCSSQCLNLVILASCNNVVDIRNFMTSL